MIKSQCLTGDGKLVLALIMETLVLKFLETTFSRNTDSTVADSMKAALGIKRFII